jgi:hypothetical protein
MPVRRYGTMVVADGAAGVSPYGTIMYGGHSQGAFAGFPDVEKPKTMEVDGPVAGFQGQSPKSC